MRSEAVSWDDWSVSNPASIADTDKWHVQFAPDEVKVVSLEQLDDLFRLSIVDSETQVWQTGMVEWQPLRVIAGLDEQPAPAPKRAPPRPPTPPTRTVVMAAQPMPQPARPVAAAAPAPRPASPSVRPAPPAARSVSLAPASFYPEPIQASASAYPAQSAYAAPLAFAATAPAMNSVRPLVVSHAPPMARGGGGFGRFLVGLALVAGVSVTAYRNDLVRDGAHAAHQDALYARLESAMGGPAFGTLRALEQNAASQPPSELAPIDAAPIRTAVSAASPAPSTPAAALGTTTPPVVSLESLAQEQKGQAAAKVQAAVAPPTAPVATPSVHAAASFVQPKPAAAPAKAPPPRPAAPVRAAVEKPAPVAQKPASEMTERERLNAAIGQSMMESTLPKAKGKKAKAKGNNEYDPLNPTL